MTVRGKKDCLYACALHIIGEILNRCISIRRRWNHIMKLPRATTIRFYLIFFVLGDCQHKCLMDPDCNSMFFKERPDGMMNCKKSNLKITMDIFKSMMTRKQDSVAYIKGISQSTWSIWQHYWLFLMLSNTADAQNVSCLGLCGRDICPKSSA